MSICPKTTDAAVLFEVSKDLQVVRIELPELRYGQLLVEIKLTGVCRSQLMEVRGNRGEDPWLPHLLGHEAIAKVLDCGPGVTTAREGDEVILTWIKGSGIDAAPATYKLDDQTIYGGAITTFSRHSIVSENRVTVKPKGMSAKTAVLFGCAIPTGAGMVINELKPEKDSKVAVLGLGGIGISSLLMLKALGLSNIVAIDVSDEKLDFARSLGISATINAAEVSVVDKALELTDGQGFDYCLESAGAVRTIELGFDIIKRNGGQLLFASHPNNEEKIQLYPHDLISGKNISGSWGGAISPDKDIGKIYKLFRRENIDTSPMTPKTYRLEDINLALEDLEAGKAFRPIIDMSIK